MSLYDVMCCYERLFSSPNLDNPFQNVPHLKKEAQDTPEAYKAKVVEFTHSYARNKKRHVLEWLSKQMLEGPLLAKLFQGRTKQNF